MISPFTVLPATGGIATALGHRESGSYPSATQPKVFHVKDHASQGEPSDAADGPAASCAMVNPFAAAADRRRSADSGLDEGRRVMTSL